MDREAKKVFSFKFKMKCKSWVSSHKKKGSGAWSWPLKAEGRSEKGGDLRRVGVLHTTVAIHKANGDALSCLAGSEFQLCARVRACASFPPSRLPLILKFRQCHFSANMDALFVSQFHAHASHPSHEMRKNKQLFDCLVTAVSVLERPFPKNKPPSPGFNFAGSVSREIC